MTLYYVEDTYAFNLFLLPNYLEPRSGIVDTQMSLEQLCKGILCSGARHKQYQKQRAHCLY